MNERYKHLKRRHTAFRDDVDEWRVKAQKKVCVLCNLARPLEPMPLVSTGKLPSVASGSLVPVPVVSNGMLPSVESGSAAVAIGAVSATVTPVALATKKKLSRAELRIWWEANNK